MEREVEMLRAHLESLATTNKYLLEERTKLLSLISSITLEKAQIQQENEQLRSELARKNQKLKVDPESHLFLNWYPNDPFTVDSYSRTFLSLVSMVRNGYRFEGRLPLRASTFLESLHHKIHQSINADYFMGIIGQGSRNPAAVFVDSVTILLTSSHLSIVKEALFLIRKCLQYCSLSNRLTLLSAKLIPRILSAPCLRDLSFVTDKGILNTLLGVLERSVRLTFTNPESARDVVLHEVLIPIEPSIIQIFHNRRLLSWNEESEGLCSLILRLLDTSVFHQPTLHFICSSRIPFVFQSLLSKVEDENTNIFIFSSIACPIQQWKEYGAETVSRERILLQALEQEGFRDTLEQTILKDKKPTDRSSVKFYSFRIMNDLGMNTLNFR